MKLRTDFVTNSSSSNFIIFTKERRPNEDELKEICHNPGLLKMDLERYAHDVYFNNREDNPIECAKEYNPFWEIGDDPDKKYIYKLLDCGIIYSGLFDKPCGPNDPGARFDFKTEEAENEYYYNCNSDVLNDPEKVYYVRSSWVEAFNKKRERLEARRAESIGIDVGDLTYDQAGDIDKDITSMEKKGLRNFMNRYLTNMRKEGYGYIRFIEYGDAGGSDKTINDTNMEQEWMVPGRACIKCVNR